MTLDELIPEMAAFLTKTRLRHIVFGGVGINFWIPPRFTNDLDLVVCIERKDVIKLVKELNALGFRVTKILQRKIMEGRMVTLPIGATKLDLRLCAMRHDYKALERVRPFIRGDTTLSIATPEDLALFKLQYWRGQDKTDVENLARLSPNLDLAYIEEWLPIVEEDSGAPVRARWAEIRSGDAP